MKKTLSSLLSCLLITPLISHAAGNECLKNMPSHYFKNSYLELQNCDLSDKDIPAVISFMKKHPVLSLELSRNHLTSTAATLLAGMKNPPQFIEMQDNAIGDQGLIALASNPAIKSIGAGNTGISDKGVARLANNKNIHMLDLSNNKLTYKSIATLSSLPSLRYLYLDGDTQIGDKGVKLLAQMNLLEVSVQNNKMNGKDGPTTLAKNSES
jgi:Leucine-rich repeat (LRR) protein